jgi:hypothetical protein
MQTRDLVNTAAKIFLFSLVALLALFTGCVLANYVGWMNHGRNASPDTGHFYGSVHADLSNPGGHYWLRFEGQSKAEWYWQRPTNFVYTHLDVQIHCFWDEAEGYKTQGTLELPSLQFRTGNTNTTLSVDLLTSLLLSPDEKPTNALQQMETIMNFIRAAGEGKLPRPQHHHHNIKEPVHTRIAHYRLGRGISYSDYAGLAIWITLVVFAAKRVFKKQMPTKVVEVSAKIECDKRSSSRKTQPASGL